MSTVSDKVLKNRNYEIAIDTKYDGNQRKLANMFDKKTGSGAKINEVVAQ